jgi:hypothetical protein
MILVLCTVKISWEDLYDPGPMSSRDKLGGHLPYDPGPLYSRISREDIMFLVLCLVGLNWESIYDPVLCTVGSAGRTSMILVLCPAEISWEDIYDPGPLYSRD